MSPLPDQQRCVIQPIKRRRPPVEPGVVFAVETRRGDFLFGRVVKEFHLFGGRVIIVYVYKHVGKTIDDLPTRMGVEDLFIEPFMMAGDLWSSYLKVGMCPFAEGELRDVEYYFGGDGPSPPLKLDADGNPIQPDIDDPLPWPFIPKEALLDLIEEIRGSTAA